MSSPRLGSVTISTLWQQGDPVRNLKCVRYIFFPLQSASSVLLLVGDTAEDLKELDEKLSFPLSCLKSKKLVKLLPFPPVQAQRYKFEGVYCLSVLLLPRCITELTGMKCFDSVSRLDVTFTFLEIEEVALASRTIFEPSFWMDWWLYAARSMILENCDKEAKCYPFVAGARIQIMLAFISYALWANTMLKHWISCSQK